MYQRIIQKCCMQICQTRPALPAHHRRISAHDGDWRCRCRNPKRIKPLTLCSSKNLFKVTPGRQRLLVRPPAVRKVDTVRPRNGHVGEPKRAGGLVGAFFFCCCTRFVVSGWTRFESVAGRDLRFKEAKSGESSPRQPTAANNTGKQERHTEKNSLPVRPSWAELG
ncbi:hypothetical protein V8C43DRAFT_316315 [Trichoderma afarasin]